MMRPAQFAGKLGEQRILARLTEIGLDPEQAAQILEKAASQPGGLVRLQMSLGPSVVSGTDVAKQK